MATYETILVDKEDGALTITLNRPDRMNAITVQALRELISVIQEAASDDGVKAVVITGAGKAFCSGNDLADPFGGVDIHQPNINRNYVMTPFVSFGWFMEQLDKFPKPLIAAVNGIASGAGLAMVAACDIRIASENARFTSIFVKRAIIPDSGTTYFLPRVVGYNKALEMMMLGDMVDAQEAKRIGLANMVVPADKLMSETKTLARRLAKGPSLAIEFTKRLTRDSVKAPDLATQLANESFAQSIIAQTEDAKEGAMAFFEKREPQYKGQ